MEACTPHTLDGVVIRFAGDSGDGMQLLGGQFTRTTALAGNDIATFPDYPSEIRAPAGTRAGVSGFQLHFAGEDIFTPGDETDVLVAMNPAALVTNIEMLKPGGIVVMNTDKLRRGDLQKADLEVDPRSDGTLDAFRVVSAPISTMTRRAVEDLGLTTKQADRCKNFFALGMMYWVYSRSMEHTESWVCGKFRMPFADANIAAMQAGYNYAITVEIFQTTYDVPKVEFPPGTYRNISGNAALALGLAAAAQQSGRLVFYGSYPITPATDILHSLAPFKHHGVVTYQAEDEIAAVCAAIGASYGGHIGVTGTSGPGVALKGEAIGLAVMVELPLVVISVQRGGPSTGLPTKTEQADLLQALYGRNGEAPMVVLAPRSPSDCFDVALEAVRISTQRMVPVFILSDGYIANGSEPWQLPDVDSLPDLHPSFHTDPEGFMPYQRDPDTLARPWAIPGTPGLEHRLGGLEKQDGTGNVSCDPMNHEMMCKVRAEKVNRIRDLIPPTEVYGDEGSLVVVGWGGTFGSIRAAVDRVRAEGLRVGQVHLRHLNPLPADLGEILRRYDTVLVPELNLGQLQKILRAEYLLDVKGLHKIQGQPFLLREVASAIRDLAAP